jgi:hypothetical protein
MVDTYGGGLFVAIVAVSFFALFSTILSSLSVPVDRLMSAPEWYRTLAIRRRTRPVLLYYTAACCVFLILSLTLPLFALLKWDQVGAQAQVGGAASWIGILIWSAVLWRTVRGVR